MNHEWPSSPYMPVVCSKDKQFADRHHIEGIERDSSAKDDSGSTT